MHRLALILASSLALATPTAAQDGSEPTTARTVEGAQRFLVEYYSRQPNQSAFISLLSGEHGLEVRSGPSSASDVAADGRLASIASEGPCRTAVKFDNLRKYTAGYVNPPPVIPNAPRELLHSIDWSQITAVTVAERREYRGQAVGVTVAGWEVSAGGLGFMPYHSTKESAQRVAFAMEFLSQQCSKSDTGF
jgi:hypothetical protein